jgi:hypothetical protein
MSGEDILHAIFLALGIGMVGFGGEVITHGVGILLVGLIFAVVAIFGGER